MKFQWIKNRLTWLSAITYVVLIVLVIFQINWLFKAARLEEQNFNHKVTMALKQARDGIAERIPQCNYMSDFLCGRHCTADVHAEKTMEVDSIIKSSLATWHIELPYQFQITDSFLQGKSLSSHKHSYYHQNLNGLLTQEGVVIEVEFPTRNQFLRRQILGELGISILFILFVFYSFIIFTRLLKRNKLMLIRTTDFINNMVHEFQTPIANVRFATNLIRKSQHFKDNPKEQEYTRVILEETLRLQKLVEDILKQDVNGNPLLMDEEFDVHQTIAQTVSKYHYRANELGATIVVKTEATQHQVMGDRASFSLVISNLIDNALKYVADLPVVEITTYNKNNRLIIKIKDNGIGISKDEQKYIFEKYYRVNTGDLHNVKGFGLGLTLVKKVIERMGGEITLESTSEKGSSFLIALPLI